jgi:FtsZ-interacting cell division protein ZipA
MKKIFLIIGVILIVAIIGLWFFYKKSPSVVPATAVETKVESLANESLNSPQINIPALTYIRARDAVITKTDTLFNNPQSVNPKIKIPTTDTNQQAQINAKRAELNILFENWAQLIAESRSLSDPNLQTLSEENRKIVADYLNQLKTIVSDLSPKSSGLPQAQIDTYQAAVEEAQKKVLEEAQKSDPVASSTPLINQIGENGLPKLIEGINRN